jgi:hypothetical protein
MSAPEVPPEPVSFTVHSVVVPARDDDVRRTRLGRLKMLLVLLICAAPVVASYLSYFVIRPEGRSNHGELITPARPMPALPLRSLDGRVIASAALKGQWLLVVVAPSACPADCEKRLYLQRQLREALGRERERIDKVWLITDDGPLAPALRQALEATPALWILRSDARAVSAWLEPAAGRALEQQIYLADPQGDWMMRFADDSDPKGIKRDLDRLLRASASWDPPGR